MGASLPSPGFCQVNDNGAAASGTWFTVANTGAANIASVFSTPLGYKPMGPVSIFCNVGGPVPVEARAW
jgi:hypothetical protein